MLCCRRSPEQQQPSPADSAGGLSATGGVAGGAAGGASEGDIIIVAVKNRISKYDTHNMRQLLITPTLPPTSFLTLSLLLFFSPYPALLVNAAVGEDQKDGTFKPTLGDVLVHFAVQLADGSWHICEVFSNEQSALVYLDFIPLLFIFSFDAFLSYLF